MSTLRRVELATERWNLEAPIKITGYTFSAVELLHATLSQGDAVGHGEGAGVYYLGETGASILAQAESVREAIEHGVDRATLRTLLPPGGARNAIDCALWDLEAKLSGRDIWTLTGIRPQRTRSFYTVGIDSPAAMARRARELGSACIKLKLDGHAPLDRVAAVRAARPDAEIIVDVNQGWSFADLQTLAPGLGALGVVMIEQPLPRGADAELEGYRSPVALCADESCLHLGELDQAARRYQMINIKLDKTGGLTEALELARQAQARGLGLMVGNMMGTSLAMAPGYVVAQLCRFADLDGALYLDGDRDHAMAYSDGVVSVPEQALWG